MFRRLSLPAELTPFEHQHLGRMNRVAITLLLLHVPLLTGVAALCDTNPLKAAVLAAITVLLPTLTYLGFSNPRHVSLVIGVTSMCICGLLVHFGKGPMQIELHFYFFVVLAVLAVFANPLVIIAAAVTVALHHFVLSLYLPSSVFNQDASIWSAAVHVLFVGLESIASCFVARSFFDSVIGFEKVVAMRTEELHRETEERKRSEALVNDARIRNAREAGMAEVATGVLHNVGNALNSVNVSVSMISDKVKHTKLPWLAKASGLLQDNASVPAFLTEHAQGKQLPGYLHKLSLQLVQEHGALLKELESLHRGVTHMTEIVTAQQTFARVGSRPASSECIEPHVLMEEALSLGLHGPASEEVEILRSFAQPGAVAVDRHRLLQILVNLISNASHAVASNTGPRRIEVRVDDSVTSRLRFTVRDNGMGIADDEKVKIFTHGFTTRTTGHGFGLHASACAAMEMRGTLTCESAGPGRGSSFTVDLPLETGRSRTTVNEAQREAA